MHHGTEEVIRDIESNSRILLRSLDGIRTSILEEEQSKYTLLKFSAPSYQLEALWHDIESRGRLSINIALPHRPSPSIPLLLNTALSKKEMAGVIVPDNSFTNAAYVEDTLERHNYGIERVLEAFGTRVEELRTALKEHRRHRKRPLEMT